MSAAADLARARDEAYTDTINADAELINAALYVVHVHETRSGTPAMTEALDDLAKAAAEADDAYARLDALPDDRGAQ